MSVLFIFVNSYPLPHTHPNVHNISRPFSLCFPDVFFTIHNIVRRGSELVLSSDARTFPTTSKQWRLFFKSKNSNQPHVEPNTICAFVSQFVLPILL